MQFMWVENNILLHGVKNKRMSTEQLCLMHPTNRGVRVEEMEEQGENKLEDMTTLLEQHGAIFVKLTELPPQ
jgi:hypothetical protein